MCLCVWLHYGAARWMYIAHIDEKFGRATNFKTNRFQITIIIITIIISLSFGQRMRTCTGLIYHCSAIYTTCQLSRCRVIASKMRNNFISIAKSRWDNLLKILAIGSPLARSIESIIYWMNNKIILAKMHKTIDI